MENEKEDGNIFIVVWDMMGLETVIDANKLIGEDVMNSLKGEKGSRLGQTMFYLTQRAKYNMQRCYEIYSIHTTADVDEAAITEMFNTDPQAAADIMRERGTKLYSDRETRPRQVIT